MPNFTIVTPVLNQVEYIEKCILSVLEQDCDVQHIIIDGGSTDGTTDIIRKYETRISYWKTEPDNGQSHAINKGLKLSTGKVFNWLNADDRLNPNALKKVLKTVNSNTAVVIGKCEHVDESNAQIAVNGARLWGSVEATLGNYSMGQPSVFYRTDIVKQLGGLNEHLHLCMDMDLWFRYLIAFGQNNVVQIKDVLSQFLVHPTSKSVDLENEMMIEKYGVYRAMISQFELPSILKDFFANYPNPEIDSKSYISNLNQTELLANFCWHLLLISYKKNELDKCSGYFEIVKRGNRLSKVGRLKWKARLLSKQLLKG